MKIRHYVMIVLTATMLTSCSGGHTKDLSTVVVSKDEEVLTATPSVTPVIIPLTPSDTPTPLPVKTQDQEKEPTIDINSDIVLPDLPDTIKNIDGIDVLKDWSILDLQENDFNGDDLQDIIGVLEHLYVDGVIYPRILFIYFNNGSGYNLNLMNQYIIRDRDNGGVYGYPYQFLSTSKNTFTTCSYGGSSWKWSEYHRYEFKEGQWYILSKEHIFGRATSDNNSDILDTSYSYDDYSSGIGFRRVTEEAFDKENRERLEYSVKLDQQPLLEDFAFTINRNEYPIQTAEIKRIGYNDGITHFKGSIPKLNIDLQDMITWNNEYIVYRIRQSDDISYLAVYDYLNQKLQMIARYETNSNNEDFLDFDNYNTVIYKDRLYYVEDINKVISIQEEDNTSKELENVAAQLISMRLDGTDKKVIFKANLENEMQFIFFSYEITGNEIIVEKHGGESITYYKMNLEGEEKVLIGEIPNVW